MRFAVLMLKDQKADSYHAPMFVPNINAALRDLQEVINTPAQPGQDKPVWARHPADFDLYTPGEWDSTTGTFHFKDDNGNPVWRLVIKLENLKA